MTFAKHFINAFLSPPSNRGSQYFCQLSKKAGTRVNFLNIHNNGPVRVESVKKGGLIHRIIHNKISSRVISTDSRTMMPIVSTELNLLLDDFWYVRRVTVRMSLDL